MTKAHAEPRHTPSLSTLPRTRLLTSVLVSAMLASLSAVSVARADGEPPPGDAPETPPPAAPAEPAPAEPAPAAPTPAAAPDVEVDAEQADLEREQREMEAEEEGPSQDEVVVESKAELEKQQRTKEAEANSKGHAMQIGLRAGFGVPFLIAARYSKSNPPCTDDPKKLNSSFCNRFMAPISEYELSFGLSDGFELTGLFRMGLSKDDVSGSLPVGFGFGFRSYTSPKSMFKFYLGVKGILDITNSDLPGWKSTDIGGRAEVGVQLDVLRYVGIWAHIAENIMVLREFAFVTDLLGGVQVRFP